MSLYLIFTDLHANAEALKRLHEIWYSVSPDHVLFLGDAVGYGADPIACIDFMQGWEELRCLLGNHDNCAGGDFSTLEGYSTRAMSSLLWTHEKLTEEHRIWLRKQPLKCRDGAAGFSHTSWRNPSAFPYLRTSLQVMPALWGTDLNVLFLGHVHLNRVWTIKNNILVQDYFPPLNKPLALDGPGRKVVQIGSAGYIPMRRNSPLFSSYAIYDSTRNTVEFKQAEYDWEEAVRKVDLMQEDSSEEDSYCEIEIPRII